MTSFYWRWEEAPEMLTLLWLTASTHKACGPMSTHRKHKTTAPTELHFYLIHRWRIRVHLGSRGSALLQLQSKSPCDFKSRGLPAEKKHRMHLSQIVGQAFKSRFSWVNTSLSTLSATTSTTIRRIPSHVGLPGNETADHQSSEVSQLLHLVNPTICSESKTPPEQNRARVAIQKSNRRRRHTTTGRTEMWSLQEIHFLLIQTKHEIFLF